MKIVIINGPNLNLLGQREPGIYGKMSFDDYLAGIQDKYKEVDLKYFQSNIEGVIIDKLHAEGFSADGIVLNAGGFTHTSVAIRDAISAITSPVVEVHISNTLAREDFRHVSMIGPACRGCIMGFGLLSYELAVLYFLKKQPSA